MKTSELSPETLRIDMDEPPKKVRVHRLDPTLEAFCNCKALGKMRLNVGGICIRCNKTVNNHAIR